MLITSWVRGTQPIDPIFPSSLGNYSTWFTYIAQQTTIPCLLNCLKQSISYDLLPLGPDPWPPTLLSMSLFGSKNPTVGHCKTSTKPEISCTRMSWLCNCLISGKQVAWNWTVGEKARGKAEANFRLSISEFSY